MTAVTWPAKSPLEVCDYGFDWTKRLVTGEYIMSSSWEYSEGIIVDEIGLAEENAKTTVIWLSGGTANKTYRFLNRIGTSGGRILEAAATIQVKAR